MKIPKGWHRLRKGTVIKEGDKFLLSQLGWRPSLCVGFKVGGTFAARFYIRRNRKGPKVRTTYVVQWSEAGLSKDRYWRDNKFSLTKADALIELRYRCRKCSEVKWRLIIRKEKEIQ